MAKESSRMLNNGQDFPPKFLQDDKLFSRLLSREKYKSSCKQGEASFRVLYYAGATGSVPFLWESQPGTPKHTFHDNPLPPLTPPPQYKSRPRANPLQKKHSKNSKFFNSIFPRVPSKKINASSFSTPPSSSSSFSSSYSLPSTPFNTQKDNFQVGSKSTVHFPPDEDEYEPGTISPTSTLCFGPRNGSPSRRFRGYSYPIKSVKKVVLSMFGQGTAN